MVLLEIITFNFCCCYGRSNILIRTISNIYDPVIFKIFKKKKKERKKEKKIEDSENKIQNEMK